MNKTTNHHHLRYLVREFGRRLRVSLCYKYVGSKHELLSHIAIIQGTFAGDSVISTVESTKESQKGRSWRAAHTERAGYRPMMAQPYQLWLRWSLLVRELPCCWPDSWLVWVGLSPLRRSSPKELHSWRGQPEILPRQPYWIWQFSLPRSPWGSAAAKLMVAASWTISNPANNLVQGPQHPTLYLLSGAVDAKAVILFNTLPTEFCWVTIHSRKHDAVTESSQTWVSLCDSQLDLALHSDPQDTDTKGRRTLQTCQLAAIPSPSTDNPLNCIPNLSLARANAHSLVPVGQCGRSSAHGQASKAYEMPTS